MQNRSNTVFLLARAVHVHTCFYAVTFSLCAWVSYEGESFMKDMTNSDPLWNVLIMSLLFYNTFSETLSLFVSQNGAA